MTWIVATDLRLGAPKRLLRRPVIMVAAFAMFMRLVLLSLVLVCRGLVCRHGAVDISDRGAVNIAPHVALPPLRA
jgi:hypothetical protein